MRKTFMTVAVCALAVAGTSACATRGYVRTQVGQVSTKVDTLSQSLEETQERTRQNETRIVQVDQKAGAAQTAANTAGSAASAADGKAVAADGKATAADQKATAASARAEAVEQAQRKIVYEVVLSENQGNFKFGDKVLPDAAKARIDELVAQIKADPKGAYFEIEGHTDNVGDATYNSQLGMDRAETVKRYLYEQHQIPLHRMNVISFGEEKPAANNGSRDGRAQNRRVVIRVLI
jgi:outer membrane protein OmpA-like peptidoglycan-associated protein